MCVWVHVCVYILFICIYEHVLLLLKNKQEVHGKYQLDDHMSHLVCCYGVWDHSITDIVTLFVTMYSHSDKVLFSFAINTRAMDLTSTLWLPT